MKHMSPQPLAVAVAREGGLYAHAVGNIHQGSFQARNKVLWAGKSQVEKTKYPSGDSRNVCPRQELNQNLLYPGPVLFPDQLPFYLDSAHG